LRAGDGDGALIGRFLISVKIGGPVLGRVNEVDYQRRLVDEFLTGAVL
jgi:hypothetical protein